MSRWPIILLAFLLSHEAQPTPICVPSSLMILTMSSFLNEPITFVIPTGRRLTALSPISASSAPLLMWISPLAKPSECAIHFLTLLTVCLDGRNRVHIVSLPFFRMKSSMSSFFPLAIITGIPSSATFWAMLHLVNIPPRPKDDLPVCMYSDRASLPFSIVRITEDVG